MLNNKNPLVYIKKSSMTLFICFSIVLILSGTFHFPSFGPVCIFMTVSITFNQVFTSAFCLLSFNSPLKSPHYIFTRLVFLIPICLLVCLFLLKLNIFILIYGQVLFAAPLVISGVGVKNNTDFSLWFLLIFLWIIEEPYMVGKSRMKKQHPIMVKT